MTILVTGATGNVGRHLVDQLIKTGAHVRALTRNPETADMPDDVDVVAGDLAVPKTLGPALEGVTSMHFITFAGNEYAPLQNGHEIVEMAASAGVQRATVLSGYLEGSVEQAVMASHLEWTILNPGEFMVNKLDWAESIRSEGVVREAFAEIPSAMVHEADIAAVAATSLLEQGHAGKTYTLTGPEAITVPEAVQTIGSVLGRNIRFIELTMDQAREQWQQLGYTKEEIDFFIEIGENTLKEEDAGVHSTVKDVTGKEARTFKQWVSEHKQNFV